MLRSFCFFFIAILFFQKSIGQIPYPAGKPGAPVYGISKHLLTLQNNAIEVQWDDRTLQVMRVRDKATKTDLSFGGLPFIEILLDHGKITSKDFSMVHPPRVINLKDSLHKSLYKGKTITADLEHLKDGIRLHWEASLKEGSNYIQQHFTFYSLKDSVHIDTLKLLILPALDSLRQMGKVDGSPMVYRNMFFAIEHPMSQSIKKTNCLEVYLTRQSAISRQHPFTVSTVIGTTPANQLRRGFLYYVERERATPYHPNLHYNSWYDLSWIDRKLNEASCLDRIQTFADSLIVKRGLYMNAFLFDDGWDDNRSLWSFNNGFPDGFTRLAKKARQYKSHLGVWISPWGGYMEDQQQRLQFGRKQDPPFETNAHGFTLTGPVYYNRFKQVAENFALKYDVSLFKFDGVGAGNGASGAGITYQNDIEALLRLVTELKAVRPSLFFSLTVGTWPSVYWLKYGDAIWRAGKDTDTAGVGSHRQQWITYHDAQTYKNVVKRAPLYPLNSLMYHGICIAENGPPSKFERNDKDIADEIWSFFGNGTNLQELYINPHLLNQQNWDCLANAIRWSRQNQHVLEDVHWIGGDPAQLEIYGFAAWSPEKAVLTLRNPSAERKRFFVKTEEVFQLPEHAESYYRFYDAKTDSPGKIIKEGSSFTIELEPFEVKVFNARPGKSSLL